MIDVKHIVKTFGRQREVKAINDVSFTAADGEITGLLGPNGAGKTTLLRIIATLMAPDGGSVTVDGRDVLVDHFTIRRSIGVLSDARGIYPRLTARENIRYFGALQGLSGDELEDRIEELLRALSIVAIARALVHDPRTILLDEPTNGLDIQSTRSLRDLLRDLCADGKCLVLSSHVMQEVSALCHRIVILGNGRVVAAGTADELLEQSGESTLENAFMHLLESRAEVSP